MQKSIYTIGYGNRKIEDFVSILKTFEIKILLDVRSYPYSRFRPSYNKSKLEESLIRNGIIYKYFGNELGGIPKDKILYTDDLPDYDKIRKWKPYQDGLEMIDYIIANENKVALMCAEQDFRRCHRHNLIGLDLQKRDYEVFHIEKDGKLEQRGLF